MVFIFTEEFPKDLFPHVLLKTVVNTYQSSVKSIQMSQLELLFQNNRKQQQQKTTTTNQTTTKKKTVDINSCPVSMFVQTVISAASPIFSLNPVSKHLPFGWTLLSGDTEPQYPCIHQATQFIQS